MPVTFFFFYSSLSVQVMLKVCHYAYLKKECIFCFAVYYFDSVAFFVTTFKLAAVTSWKNGTCVKLLEV